MLANRVREFTTTVGTGDITLGGAFSGYIRFADAFAVTDSVIYVIEDGDNYEIGTGTLSGANTLARTTVSETLVDGVLNKETPAAIDLSGEARIYCAVSADYLLSSTKEADVITEVTPGAGVTVDGVTLKDGSGMFPASVTASLGTFTSVVENGETLSGKYLGIVDTAAAAEKLSNARSFNITGDASGAASFDGTADINIALTVADNSHNHTLENIAGASAALASKFDKAGGTVAGDIVVAGQLTVQGDVFTQSSNDVNIGDSILTLNAELAASATPSVDAGVEVNRGSEATAYALFREGTDTWNLSHSLQVEGDATITGGLSAAGSVFSGTVAIGGDVPSVSWKQRITNIAGGMIEFDRTASDGVDTIFGLIVSGDGEPETDFIHLGAHNSTDGLRVYGDGHVVGRGWATFGGKLTVNGGAKIGVQNQTDGGPDNGIFLWDTVNTNHVIYLAGAGEGKSVAGNTSCTSLDGRTSLHTRLRTYATPLNGFMFENSVDQCLMSLTGDTGDLYTKGDVNSGGLLNIASESGTPTLKFSGSSFGGQLTDNSPVPRPFLHYFWNALDGNTVQLMEHSLASSIKLTQLNGIDVQGKMAINSGVKINLQNGHDGGNEHGLFFVNNSDTKWGLYAGSSGALKSLDGATATTSLDGRAGYHIRSRAYDIGWGGFLWENSSEQCLMSLTADTGDLYTKGRIRINSDDNIVIATPSTYSLQIGTAGTDYAGIGGDGSSAYFQSWGGRTLHINSQGNAVTVGGSTTMTSKLTVDGGAKISVQQGTNGGSTHGIRLWAHNDSGWGHYMASSAGLSMADGVPCVALDGRTGHHVRARSSNSVTSGFLWENNSESCLMSLTGDTGDLYTKGGVNVGDILSVNRGGSALKIGPGTQNHAYMEFYAETANPSARSGFLGFGGSGSPELTLSNEYANGPISFRTVGGVSLTLHSDQSAAFSGKVTVYNGAKISVQNKVDGGTDHGIYWFDTDNTNYVSYLATASVGNSAGGGNAPASFDGRTSFHLRHRVASGVDTGFLWENSSNTRLMSLTADTGDLHTKGGITSRGNVSIDRGDAVANPTMFFDHNDLTNPASLDVSRTSGNMRFSVGGLVQMQLSTSGLDLQGNTLTGIEKLGLGTDPLAPVHVKTPSGENASFYLEANTFTPVFSMYSGGAAIQPIIKFGTGSGGTKLRFQKIDAGAGVDAPGTDVLTLNEDLSASFKGDVNLDTGTLKYGESTLVTRDGDTNFRNVVGTGKLTVDGGAKISVQNKVNGGNANGIFWWDTDNSTYVSYMATGGSPSANDSIACTSLDGRTGFHLRTRLPNNEFAAKIWENSTEHCLMSLTADGGDLYTKGIITSSNQFRTRGAGRDVALNPQHGQFGAVVGTVNGYDFNVMVGNELALNFDSPTKKATFFAGVAATTVSPGQYSSLPDPTGLTKGTIAYDSTQGALVSVNDTENGWNVIGSAGGSGGGSGTPGVVDGNSLTIGDNTDLPVVIQGKSDRSGANYNLLNLDGVWNTTRVARIALLSGSDTVNKDDGQILFQVAVEGGVLQEALKLNSDRSASFAGTVDVPHLNLFEQGGGLNIGVNAGRVYMAPWNGSTWGFASEFGYDLANLRWYFEQDALVNGKLTIDGGAKISVQNQVNGGSGQGIFLWDTSDTNWGLYMAQAGAGKSLADGVATASLSGATSYHIRHRVNTLDTYGFIWENNAEQCLMSLAADTGDLYTKGNVDVGGKLGVGIDPVGDLHVLGSVDARIGGTGSSYYTYFQASSGTSKGAIGALPGSMRVQSLSSLPLQLFNTQGLGIQIQNATGDARFTNGAEVLGKLTVDGGACINVGNDAGSSKGIFWGANNDTNWGDYLASTGLGKSLSDGVACASLDGRLGASRRSRVYSGANHGFIWENHLEQCLMSLAADTGDLYTKGLISAPEITIGNAERIIRSVATGRLVFSGGSHEDLGANIVAHGETGGPTIAASDMFFRVGQAAWLHYDHSASTIDITEKNITGAFDIHQSRNDSRVNISGGDISNNGSNLTMYGSAAAGRGNDFEFRADGVAVFNFDYSASKFDFQNHHVSGVSKLTCGQIDASGVLSTMHGDTAGRPSGAALAALNPGSRYYDTEADKPVYVNAARDGWVEGGGGGSGFTNIYDGGVGTGTSFTVANIDPSITEIEVLMEEVTAGAAFSLQLGDSGGVEENGYAGVLISPEDVGSALGINRIGSNNRDSIPLSYYGTGSEGYVECRLVKMGTNKWKITATAGQNSSDVHVSTGIWRKTLSGDLTQLKFFAGGTNFFGGNLTVAAR